LPSLSLRDRGSTKVTAPFCSAAILAAVCLRPEAVAQIEFLEWTEADRLRHSKFVGLREEKKPRSVVKEQAGEPRITSA
jgi:ATP-dependent DNA ligase